MTTRTWRHDMFVYEDDAAFERLVAPYLEAGVDEGDALMAVFVPDKQELLRDALGTTCDQVDISDANDVYTRPEDVLSRYDATMRRLLADGARSIRFIGELPICATQEQWDVWMLYEGLLNHAFAHLPLRVVCTYDERVFPASIVEASRRTHPHVHHGDWEGGEWHDSAQYDPTEVVRSLTAEARPLDALRELPVAGDARALRRALAHEMGSSGVPSETIQRLLIAAGEAAANAVQHGGGLSSVRVGQVDGRFVCELVDNGPGFDDPLAGHLPPRPGGDTGAGLWVVRQLTSRVEFLTGAAGGLTTRLWG
jgi:anti-sigma regulatory factor (Ser/Thr protein kinase)